MLRDDSERGSAAVEFLSMGVLLLVPLVYLVLTLSALQGASFAAEGAARQAARAYVLSPTDAQGRARAEDAVRTGLADWNISAGASSVRLTCSPDPDRCLTPSGTVTASVRVVVALPLLPPALHLTTSGSIPVDATAVQPVSTFVGANR